MRIRRQRIEVAPNARQPDRVDPPAQLFPQNPVESSFAAGCQMAAALLRWHDECANPLARSVGDDHAGIPNQRRFFQRGFDGTQGNSFTLDFGNAVDATFENESAWLHDVSSVRHTKPVIVGKMGGADFEHALLWFDAPTDPGKRRPCLIASRALLAPGNA